MINAKKELQSVWADHSHQIKCAEIKYYLEYDIHTDFHLNVGHTVEELQSWFNLLDFQYDNGYGGQMLFGTIWFDDGTWLERDEYDGSESWVFREYPDIPEYLKQTENYENI